MKRLFKLKLDLQLFAEESAGVEGAPVAGEQTDVQSPEQTGVNEPGAAAQEGEQTPQIQNEKDFAKALKAREEQLRQQLEQEYAQRYQDYDVLKRIAEFVKNEGGYQDYMSINEQIEMVELQKRAQSQGISPELQKRLEVLEEKARKAEELEQKQKEAQEYQAWRKELEAFAQGKDVDADKLESFMYEKRIGDFEAAYKAMMFDELINNIEELKKQSVKEFIETKKKIPKVEGGGPSGQVIPGTPKTWADARMRALSRLENWGKQAT